MVHGRTDPTAAVEIRQFLTGAGVWDGTAVVFHAARTAAGPPYPATPTGLYRIDPKLDVEPI